MTTPQHTYSIQQYIAINDISQLQKLFKNEQFYIRTLVTNRADVQKIATNPEYAKQKLDGYDTSIKNGMEAADNIIKAIQFLEQGRRR